MIDKKDDKQKKSRGVRPTGLEKKYLMARRYADILSVWSKKPLDFLSASEVTTQFNTKSIANHGEKLSVDTIRSWLEKGVKDGIFVKKSNRYRPKTVEAASEFAPAFIIENRDFSGSYSLVLSRYEMLYFYDSKKLVDDYKEGIPIGLFPEIKKLGAIFKEALENFFLQTGVQPRLVAFTHDTELIDPRSYIQRRLEFELLSLIYNNIKNIPIWEEWFDEELREDFIYAIIRIFQEALTINIAHRNDIDDTQKRKFLKKIAEGEKGQPEKKFLKIMAEQYLLNLNNIAINLQIVKSDELELLIKKEADQLYNKLQTKKSVKDN